MFYWIAYYVMKCIGGIFAPLTVLGKDNIPLEGSFLLASNHISNIDPFLIGLAVHRRTSYMAKDSLFRKPLLRAFFNAVEAYPVRRGASDVRAIRETLRRLKRGLPIVIFPEGTRRASGAEQKQHTGIGFIAVKGDVPVVPVHIAGSDRVLPPGARIFKRGRVTISFGKPLRFSKNQPYSEIVADVMKEIGSLSQVGSPAQLE